MTIKALVEEGKELLEGKTVPKITKWVDEYETDDYPYGRERTKATFTVEKTGKKQRVSRVTVNPKTGRPNKPKKTTYGIVAKLGIGADGRTYVGIYNEYGAINIWSGDMKRTQAHVVYEDPEFEGLFRGILGDQHWDAFQKAMAAHEARQ